MQFHHHLTEGCYLTVGPVVDCHFHHSLMLKKAKKTEQHNKKQRIASLHNQTMKNCELAQHHLAVMLKECAHVTCTNCFSSF